MAVGARMAGVEELGVEFNEDVIKTRELNGFNTTYRDVWDIENSKGLDFTGLWASPPCQTFSTALSPSSGITAAPKHELVDAIHSKVWRNADDLRAKEKDFGDPRSSLVLTPLLYTYTHTHQSS